MADTKGILVAMGLGPKPSPSSTPPSSVFDKLASASRSPTPPRSTPNAPAPDDGMQMGGKASRDEAGYVPDENVCGGCINYTKESGDCAKVEGVMEPCDGCRKYFEAANKTAGGEGDMGLEIEGQPTHDETLGGMNTV